ncbi:MAG: aryl-sulfate sulfotransferase [Halobacteriales archaeon]
MRPAGVMVVLLVIAGMAPAFAAGPTDGTPCAGTITEPAGGMTVISVQGFRFGGNDSGKKPARLIGVGPAGEIRWVHRLGRERGVVWSYDVDPLPNGNLFGTATRPGKTLFYELDPRTGEWVWSEVVNFTDTHDADMLDRHRILVANMRNYDAENGTNDDRILIYNRTSGAVEWEWLFREAGYDPEGGGAYAEDWTHVNDVDRIAPGKFLVSPRNFDQAIVVDRSTGEVTLQLGADEDHEIMKEQHNPQYLESKAGDPTVLVADSENDRIVEYEKAGDGWRRTWELGSSETLSWPRDADRLPDGNTLIADSTGNRVLEVTPTGEIVWEFHAPWLVYDAERIPIGDEPGGPTIADQDAEGSYELPRGPRDPADLESCAETLRSHENQWGTATPANGTAGDVTGTTGQDTDGTASTDGTPRTEADPASDGTATSRAGEEDPASEETAKSRASVATTDERTKTPGQAGFGPFAAILIVAVLVLVRSDWRLP